MTIFEFIFLGTGHDTRNMKYGNCLSGNCRLRGGGGMVAMISHGYERKKRGTLIVPRFYIMVSGAGFEPARVLPH